MAPNELPPASGRADSVPTYLTCDGCHKAKPDVQEVEDPYIKEIEDKSVLRDLCDDCLQLSSEDI